MTWTWNGAEIVTTLLSLLLSTGAAVLLALWLQRKEFAKQTADRREQQKEKDAAERDRWRRSMADEALVYTITMREAAMDAGNAYKQLMIDRWLSAFQARLGLGRDRFAANVAVVMRHRWKDAYAAAAQVNRPVEDREAASHPFISELQRLLRAWGNGEIETEEWARLASAPKTQSS